MSAQIDIDHRQLNIVHVSCENTSERRRTRINGDKVWCIVDNKDLKDVDLSVCGESNNQLKINLSLSSGLEA